MKVAIATAYASKIAGSRKELLESLINKGYQVEIFGDEPVDICQEKLTPLGIIYHQIKFQRSSVNPFHEIKVIYEAIKVFRNCKIDVLLIYGVRISASFALAARISGIKRVYTVINGAGTLFSIGGIKGSIIRCLSYPLLFTGLRLCKQVIFQNLGNKELFRGRFLVSEKRSKVVAGSGVNTQRYSYEPMPEEFNFLMVGRLIQDKGVFEFIQAAKKVKALYPQATFTIVGPYDDNLTAISGQEINEVINEGIVSHVEWTDNIETYYRNCFAFVLPSYHEGMPRTVLEAMATGRPIITTNVPGCRETVIDGINGFLVPKKADSMIANKMIWMIQHPNEARKMGEESRKICELKFDVNKVNENIFLIMDL